MKILLSTYIFTFIAGILVSFATNLFTTALLSKDLTIDTNRVYGIAFSLLISSIGAFGVSLLLETARGKWELGGAEMDSGVIRGYIEKYMRWILLCFIIFIIGLTAAIFYYSNTVFNYFLRIVGYQ